MGCSCLAALEQAHVLERVVGRKRSQQLAQHGRVGLPLVLLGLTGDQAWSLVDGGVDNVVDVPAATEGGAADGLVLQVRRQVRERPAADSLGRAPRHATTSQPSSRKALTAAAPVRPLATAATKSEP